MKKIVSVNLIATFFLFPGCTKEKKIPLSKEENTTFRWAVRQIPKTLDWRDCDDELCRHQSYLLMEGLSRLTVADGNIHIVPALAERWEYISPREIKITLRKNIFWEDGTPLTAAHFVGAWEGTKTHLLDPVLNMRSFRNRKSPFSSVGVRAIDSHTIRIVLETPHPNFMSVMADPVTFPWAGSRKRVPLVLGPYRLAETTAAQRTFQRNASYYGTPPAFSRVEFVRVDSEENALQLFAEGQADFVDDLSRPDPRALLVPTSRFVLLAFSDSGEIENPNLRRALRLSIDAGEFQRILKRQDLPSRRLFPFEPREANAFAPDRAKELFEGVYPKGLVKSPLTLGLSVSKSARSAATELAKNLQAQWLKNLGPAFQFAPEAPEPDIQLKEWTWDPRRPFMGMETELSAAFRSQRKISALSLFATSEDSILRKLLRIEDALLEEDLAVMPLVQRNRRVLVRSHIRGMGLNPLELWDLREVTN